MHLNTSLSPTNRVLSYGERFGQNPVAINQFILTAPARALVITLAPAQDNRGAWLSLAAAALPLIPLIISGNKQRRRSR